MGSVESFDPIVDDVIAATGWGGSRGGAQQDVMQKVLERLEKIELQLATRKETVEDGRQQPNDSAGTRPRQRSNQRKVICWRCQKEGHIARHCYSGRQEQDQGNGKPLEQ